MQVSVEADLLKTLPCVGPILSMVLMLEIGRVDRFPTAAHLAIEEPAAIGASEEEVSWDRKLWAKFIHPFMDWPMFDELVAAGFIALRSGASMDECLDVIISASLINEWW